MSVPSGHLLLNDNSLSCYRYARSGFRRLVNPTEELHTCQCWRLAGAEMTFEHAAENSWGQYISARHYSGVNFMAASQIQALGSQMQNFHHAKTSRCKRTWKRQQNPWRDRDGDKYRAGLAPELSG